MANIHSSSGIYGDSNRSGIIPDLINSGTYFSINSYYKMAEGAKIDYYYSSVSSNLEIKKQQERIQNVLDGKKIPYNKIDIAASEDDKAKMRRIIGDDKALAPQLANGEQYCGNFDKFEEAIESENLNTFLKL